MFFSVVQWSVRGAEMGRTISPGDLSGTKLNQFAFSAMQQQHKVSQFSEICDRM